MNSDYPENSWSNLYNRTYFLAQLSSVWRSRHTYSLIADIKIKTLLELGGGTGLCAHYLTTKTKATTTLLEKNSLLAKKLLQKYPEKNIILADLFKFKTKQRWDLVYSLGVIEHFSPKLRLRAIKIHKELAAKYVLIAVPVNTFPCRINSRLFEKRHAIQANFYKNGAGR